MNRYVSSLGCVETHTSAEMRGCGRARAATVSRISAEVVSGGMVCGGLADTQRVWLACVQSKVVVMRV